METVHYSQEEPCFELAPAHGNTRLDVRGSGFLTADLINGGLRRWALQRRLSGQQAVPEQVCIDLRNVTGYGAGCARIAHGWLKHAGSLGVRQVAMIASSAVLRTATVMMAKGLSVQLRCFGHWDAADAWLRGVDRNRTTVPSPWSPAELRARGSATEPRLGA